MALTFDGRCYDQPHIFVYKGYNLATEEGIIIKTDIDTAWAKTIKGSSCEACSSKDSCSEMQSGKEMLVEAYNPVGAKTGDKVVLSFATTSLLKAMFMLYIFPIICMIAGAFTGHNLAFKYNYNDSFLSALFAFLFFSLAILLIRLRSEKMAKKNAYKPKIIRIVTKSQGTGIK